MGYSNCISHNETVSYRSVDRCTLTVYNSSDTIIKACTVVSLASFSYSCSNGILDRFVINAVPAESDGDFWGVAVSDIPSNLSGTIVINGVAKAFISSGYGAFAVPGTDGKLTAAVSGRAKILWRGDEQNPGWVILGGSANQSSYHGPFAVRYLGERNFEIYDTTYPDITDDRDSKICGHTDLPGDAYYVARQIFTLPEDYSTATIYLVACYKDDKYSTLFSHQPQPANSGAFANVAVASVSASGEITQKLTSGTAVFGRDWFL